MHPWTLRFYDEDLEAELRANVLKSEYMLQAGIVSVLVFATVRIAGYTVGIAVFFQIFFIGTAGLMFIATRHRTLQWTLELSHFEPWWVAGWTINVAIWWALRWRGEISRIGPDETERILACATLWMVVMISQRLLHLNPWHRAFVTAVGLTIILSGEVWQQLLSGLVIGELQGYALEHLLRDYFLKSSGHRAWAHHRVSKPGPGATSAVIPVPGEASGKPRAPRWVQGLGYVCLFLLMAYITVSSNYMGTPVAATCACLLAICVGLLKQGPGPWTLDIQSDAPGLPYIHCTGVCFWLALLLHINVMPIAAPGTYAVAFHNQLTLTLTWFVLGVLGGSEAGSIPTKVGCIIFCLLFAEMRTRIIDGLLSQSLWAAADIGAAAPSLWTAPANLQVTATYQPPTMRELAMRSQMAPGLVGHVIGTLLRFKWHRVVEAAVTEKELLTQALSNEVQWLRSHATDLETARRDALAAQTRSKTSAMSPSSQRRDSLRRRASSDASSAGDYEVAPSVVSSEGASSRSAHRSPARSRRPHGLSPVREW